VCGSAPSGAFQRRKVDLLLSLATSAAAARARRGPPSPDPAARSRPFDPACCVENRRIVPTHALRFRCCRCAGRGEGGGGEGGTIIAFSDSILGDARRPLCAAAARSRLFDPASAWRSCVLAPLCDFLCRCCCSQGKGQRRRERARSSCTRLRHEMDDDKEDKKKADTVFISTI
jgi:hypothetical protein